MPEASNSAIGRDVAAGLIFADREGDAPDSITRSELSPCSMVDADRAPFTLVSKPLSLGRLKVELRVMQRDGKQPRHWHQFKPLLSASCGFATPVARKRATGATQRWPFLEKARSMESTAEYGIGRLRGKGTRFAPVCEDFARYLAGTADGDEGVLRKAVNGDPLLRRFFNIDDAQWRGRMDKITPQHNYPILTPPSYPVRLPDGTLMGSAPVAGSDKNTPMQANDPNIFMVDPWKNLLPELFSTAGRNEKPTNYGASRAN